jgi:hypothetical protein
MENRGVQIFVLRERGGANPEKIESTVASMRVSSIQAVPWACDPAAAHAGHRGHRHPGFLFSWNALTYPLTLAVRQTFPVTVG